MGQRSKRDKRFTEPLMTPAVAAVHLGIPRNTVRSWVKGQLVHAVPSALSQAPTVPFVALVEAQILRELRDAGLSMQELRAGVKQLQRDTDQQYVLARNDIATDGGSLLYNAATKVAPEWVRAKDRQGTFRQVIEALFRFVSYADDGYAQRLRLRPYGQAEVIVDPRFGWGRPVLSDTKVPVDVIADLFFAGESVEDIADDYDISTDQVQAVVRVMGRSAAA
jgi:uncharacterized protein (DUF433 family)